MHDTLSLVRRNQCRGPFEYTYCDEQEEDGEWEEGLLWLRARFCRNFAPGGLPLAVQEWTSATGRLRRLLPGIKAGAEVSPWGLGRHGLSPSMWKDDIRLFPYPLMNFPAFWPNCLPHSDTFYIVHVKEIRPGVGTGNLPSPLTKRK